MFLDRCWILLEPSLAREGSRVEELPKPLRVEGILVDLGRLLRVEEKDEVELKEKMPRRWKEDAREWRGRKKEE